MEEYDKERLLGLLGALIKAADSDLVNNRRCFPCKKEDHEHYKAIRNSYLKIYDEANFASSEKFLTSVKGKSEKFIQMKAKMFNDPVQRKAHMADVLDKLCSLTTINEAKQYINVEHHELYNQAMLSLEKCSDA
jgi:hypothetical protein